MRGMRWMSAGLALILMMSIGSNFVSSPVGAAGCQTDQEPSEKPEEAPSLAGAVCVDGTMPEGDQDLFRWTVAEGDGPRRWTLSLTGIPTTQTLLQLRRVDSPVGTTPVQLSNPFVELAVQPQVTEPAVATDLLVPPGDYVVAIGRGGV